MTLIMLKIFENGQDYKQNVVGGQYVYMYSEFQFSLFLISQELINIFLL